MPDTTPGVRPIHAEGMLVAKVVSCSPNSGDYYVSEVGTKKRRRVPSNLLVPTCLDSLAGFFRGSSGRGGTAGREVARARLKVAKVEEESRRRIEVSENEARQMVSRARKGAQRATAIAEQKVRRGKLNAANLQKEVQLDAVRATKRAGRS